MKKYTRIFQLEWLKQHWQKNISTRQKNNMKISKRSLKKIIRETTASDPVQMLINFLSNNDIFMGTEQVVYWLQQQGIEETQIDSILNDSRLDNYYEESDDSWGISEVPYKFPKPIR